MALVLSLHNIAVVVACVVFLTVIKRRYFSSISDIPGPFWGSFWIGWQLWHIVEGHTEEQLVNLHRKHGKFVRISHKEVSVAHPDAVDQVLKSQWRKGQWYKIFDLPDPDHVNQMSELDPKRHIQKNKNVMTGYSLSSLLRSESHIDSVLKLMTRRFDALIVKNKPMEPPVWFNFMAFDILGEMIFSKSFGFLQKGYDIGGAIKNTSQLAIYVAIMGHLQWLHKMLLGNPLIQILGLQPNQHIFDTTLATIKSRKENPEVRRDMVEQWTERYAAVKDKGLMEEKEILCAAIANIGAGADTVSATMQAVFHFLIRSPEWYAKLQKEIDDAFERGELGTVNQIPEYAATQKLPILQACLRETYRMHPAVGFGLPRVVPAGGAVVCGRYFPPGTTLSVPIWPIHRNPEIFGEDCDSYNPGRWLIDDQAVIELRKKFLLQFSAGYNMCPGRHLAHLEISKATTLLMRDYDISLSKERETWDYVCHFTIVPKNWQVDIKRRRGELDPVDGEE